MLLVNDSVAAASPKVPTNSPPVVPAGAVLSATVLLTTVTVPSVMNAAPPCQPTDWLPLSVLLVIQASPRVRRPPPTSAAVLPLIVLPSTIVVVSKNE